MEIEPAGFTLPQLLMALVLIAIGLGVAIPTGGTALDAFALRRAGDLARGHLARARLLAVARREIVRVRAGPEGELLALGPDDASLAVTHLDHPPLGLDSLRLQPSTLRFNARGQAAPGSVYLYRGRRGVRLVCNFLGRVRRETFPVP